MFLAGSFFPIPWEFVLLLAGASGLNPLIASIYASLGATIGSILGYFSGRYFGRIFIIKYGKYFLISIKQLEYAEKWISKWGIYATLILRSIQYLPYKIYNLAAGISRMNFLNYTIFTLIGTLLRCFYMIYIGKAVQFNTDLLIALIFLFLIFSIIMLKLKK